MSIKHCSVTILERLPERLRLCEVGYVNDIVQPEMMEGCTIHRYDLWLWASGFFPVDDVSMCEEKEGNVNVRGV